MEKIGSWLSSLSKKSHTLLILSVVVSVVSSVLLILQIAFLSRIISLIIIEKIPVQKLYFYFIALPCILVLRFFAIGIARCLALRAGQRVKQGLREDLIAAMTRCGPARVEQKKAGEFSSTIVDATENIEPYFSSYLPQRAVAMLFPFTVLVVLFPLDWISGLVLLGTAICLPLTMILIGGQALERNRRQWSLISRLNGYFLDLLYGLVTLKVFGAVGKAGSTLAHIAEAYRQSSMSVLRLAFLSSFMLELLTSLSIAIVAVITGFRLLSGTFYFGTAYFILLLAPEYFLVLRALGTTYHVRMQAYAAAQKIMELLEFFSPPLHKSKVDSPVIRSSSKKNFLSIQGLCLERGGRSIIENLDIDLESEEHILLSGPSGSGKSSLFAVLLGFLHPVAGKIFWNGEEIKDCAALRSVIAWMPQRPTLFSGTLADNIRLAKPDATREEVLKAGQAASLDFMDTRGLDSLVGEGGMALSTGQIGRVAMARLFLLSPRLVLLDEPTAHLDFANETSLLASIRALAVGKCMIISSHREIQGMDRVVDLSLYAGTGSVEELEEGDV